MDIRRRLISLRQQCGLTQNGLAEKAGVSQSHLRRFELGQADITISHLGLLCDAMNVSLKEFFDVENKNPTELNKLIESAKSLDTNAIKYLNSFINEIKK